MLFHRVICATLLLAGVGTSAFAQDASARKFQFMAGFGYTLGGDTIVPITLTPENVDGKSYHEDLSGGAGLDLRLGVQMRLSDKMRLQAMAAYHNDQANGIHGHASFRRIPVELVAHWRTSENWWLGVGVRQALNGMLDRQAGFKSGDTPLPARKWEVSFSPALILEAEYMMSPNWGLKMRGVKEHGKFKEFEEKFNADHVGAMVLYYFD